MGGAGSVLFFEVAAVTQVCSLCENSLSHALDLCTWWVIVGIVGKQSHHSSTASSYANEEVLTKLVVVLKVYNWLH